MGGCYSTSSQSAVTSPVHKRPRLKSSKRSKKKSQYMPVNGRDGQEQENSSTRDSACVEGDSDKLEGTNGGVALTAKEEKGVAPSDSGIESLEYPKEELDHKSVILDDLSESVIPDKEWTVGSLGDREYTLCHSCHAHLQRVNCGLCRQCGHFRIDPSALSGLVVVDRESETYCTCGPRQLGKASTCRTHGGRTYSPSASAYRRLNLSSSKSDVKEENCSGGEGNHIGSDAEKGSISSKNNCHLQDPAAPKETKSPCLSEKFEKNFYCDGAFLASKLNTCETLDFICKCDHSYSESDKLYEKVDGSKLSVAHSERDHIRGSLIGLLSTPVKGSLSRLPVDGDCMCMTSLENNDEGSGHGVSKSESRSESTSDLDLETRHRKGAGSISSSTSVQSSPYRLAAERALSTVSDDSEDMVCPVTVNGREMVMINANTYSCMLRDLALLKEQLQNLTFVIQEEGTEAVSPLGLSLQMNQ